MTSCRLAPPYGVAGPLPNQTCFNSGQPEHGDRRLATLHAIPDEGETFLGWNGDAGGTNTSLEITLDQTQWISASFTRRPRLAISDCPGLNKEIFPLRITGELGRLSLETSSNLVTWVRRATLTNLFGTVQFNDPLTTKQPSALLPREQRSVKTE